jgi:outer membrane protein assembly factor BamB
MLSQRNKLHAASFVLNKVRHQYAIGCSILILIITSLLFVLIPTPFGPHNSEARNVREIDADVDWPQLGHDPQRTNATSLQVDPPYCYTWKWYEVPLASRVQPVDANGRLFIGSMNSIMYAREASTGASLWTFQTDGPIRSSAGVTNDAVIFTSHDGYTYAVSVNDGSLQWKTRTGPSVTAPVLDSRGIWAYVGSVEGTLTALSIADGTVRWIVDSGAPILTSPSMSLDETKVFFGNEDIEAIALRILN